MNFRLNVVHLYKNETMMQNESHGRHGKILLDKTITIDNYSP